MTKLELLTKYLHQVDPYWLATSFEIWYDLKDRVGKGTVFEYEEDQLRLVIARAYYAYIPTHYELAKEIFFSLEKP